MSDAVSFAEIDEQRAELLPERTVMSLASMAGGNTGCTASGNAAGGTGTLLSNVPVVGTMLSSATGSGCHGTMSSPSA